MANVILIKRGLATDIDKAALREGELALGWSADKKAVTLYVGNGTGAIPVFDLTSFTDEVNGYTDQKISDLIDGAPEAWNTLKEIADYIATHTDEYEALQSLVGDKLTKPTTDGTTGQILKRKADGTLEWADETDTTYGAASSEAAGLMSAADKEKLDAIKSDEGDTQTVSASEKTTWNAKLDSSSEIDGGTF